jgi:glycosyltransferase involved in cell wall biosynthesis
MPVLNEEKYLEAAVQSILTQEFKGPVEVILALGPSTDHTDAKAALLATAYPQVKIVRNPAGTTSAGLNAAIAASSHQVIVRVDAHSVLSDGYTKLAVEILNETMASNVGGVMRAVGHTPFQSAVAWAYTSRVGLGGGAYHVGGEAGPADSVYLGVFRRDIFSLVGGFDESVIRGQDWELNLRIRQSGHTVWFDPRLQVEYHPRASLGKLAKQFWDTGLWRGQLTRQSLKTANPRYFAPPLLVKLSVIGAILALGLGWGPGWLPLLGYLMGICLAGMTAGKLQLGARTCLLVALPTMHFLWGAGFIGGFLFGARKRR